MNKPWLNAELPVSERVELLLKEMTLNEKIGQLLSTRGYQMYKRINDREVEMTDEFKELYEEFPGAQPGSWNRADWYSGRNWENGLTPELIPVWHNMMQKYAVENTRLGIPLMLGAGINHGVFALGGSAVPCGIGLASTWNRGLIRRIFDALADEGATVTAANGSAACGPTQDLARDPRWSRVEETWGEDPFLSAEMSVAFHEGLSTGKKEGRRYFVGAARHFLCYGETEGGHNSAPAHCGQNELFNIHLRPFEALLKAGAGNIMTSYNLVDGIPCTVSPLIEEILRGKWNWEGTVTADAYAICSLVGQGFANDLGDAAALAVKTGTDNCCWEGQEFKKGLSMAFERGQLTDEDLNVHVRRILKQKFESGIFEHPYIEDVGACARTFRCRKSREASLAAARESLVLIKNDAETLPLKKIGRLALVGPNADCMHSMIGDYSAPQRPGDVVTVRAGLEAMGKESDMKVAYARGCGLRSMKTSGFAEALETVDGSDAVVVVLGGSSIPNMELLQEVTGASIAQVVAEDTEQDKDCGEGYDRARLHLGGAQLPFLKAVSEKAHALGKKVIAVMIMGRPLILTDICDHADAVILAWYPGMDGGTAIAETLFGQNNPSGKLPLTFPDTEGQLPVYYNTLKTRNNYIDQKAEPAFLFGTGLSYTRFEISDVRMEKAESGLNETNHVFAKVKNTGSLAGADVLQMYVSDVKFTVARPRIELKGFEKIFLAPGEEREVCFALTDKELGYYNRELEYVTEPGEFKIRISDNGPRSGLETSFILKD